MSDDRQTTHWEGCHTKHLDCALARIAELEVKTASQQEWIDRAVASCTRRRCSQREARIAELDTKTAELEADKARLDWVLKSQVIGPEAKFGFDGNMQGDRCALVLVGGRTFRSRDSLRAAIDAAMKPANVETRDPAYCYCPGNQIDGPCDGWTDEHWCWSLNGHKPTD